MSLCCCTGESSEFEEIFSCKANGVIPVTKYISKSSGLQIVHAEIDGPTINGYITVCTRAADDDGLPHTLEHLIFLGSEDYPYKGVLDKLANKCLASGTNAWTDVDHTCYTLSTAGSEGFCTLLPIFMDHIFYPLLTETAFKTEVFHVTGSGMESGVVYSEMQALENTCYEKSTNTLLKAIYPPDSGYHYNTGGVLKNLRESCDNEKVKAFHKTFYHPQNSCLIVCGTIDRKHLFHCLIPVIKKFARKKSLATQNWKKPWLSEYIPDVAAPHEICIRFPADSMDGGYLITVGFLGPVISNWEEMLSLLILLKYLVDNSCAPLQQAFVERHHDSLAASIAFTLLENIRPTIFFEVEGVSFSNKSKVVGLLRRTVQCEVDSFDMTRMADTIHANMQAELTSMENVPDQYIARVVTRDFIYGSDERLGALERQLNGVSVMEELLSKSESYWVRLLKEQLLDSNWVAIIAEPSKVLQAELREEEEARVSTRRVILGAQGLLQLARELDEAILINSKPVPERVIRKVSVPTMKSIKYHKITRSENPPWAKSFPANFYLDDISTSFVYVNVLMDTSSLKDEYRQYLPLFKEVILNSPCLEQGCLIPYEQVVAMRSRELHACEINLGLELFGTNPPRFSSGSYSHLLAFELQMEMQNIEKGMMWIRKTLWDTKWDPARVRVGINKMVSDIFALRRDGSRMCQVIFKSFVYQEGSNVAATSLLHQLDFLMTLQQDAKRPDKVKQVINALDVIRNLVTQPQNISVHVATNMSKLQEQIEANLAVDVVAVDQWLSRLLKQSFPFSDSSISKRLSNSSDTDTILPSVELKDDVAKQIIFGLSSEDSSYLILAGPGPTEYRHPDVPALWTTIQYLIQLEGPLYHIIRGRGYAYAYNAVLKVNEGLIYFCLAKCSNVVGAYGATLGVLKGYLSRSVKWSAELLTAAKSSLIFECLDTEKTPLKLASSSVLAYYRNVNGSYCRDLCIEIQKVGISDLKRMCKKYLLPMFSKNYPCVVVCPMEQVERMHDGFKELGKRLLVVKSFDDLTF